MREFRPQCPQCRGRGGHSGREERPHEDHPVSRCQPGRDRQKDRRHD